MAIPVSNSVVLPPIDGNNGTLTDEFINGLVQGSAWQFAVGTRMLTYSFNVNWDFDEFGNIIQGVGGNWTAPLMDAVNRALTEWSSVANISFQNIVSGTYGFQSSADIAITLTGNELQSDPDVPSIGLGILPDPSLGALFRDAYATVGISYPQPEGDIFLDNGYSGYQYLYAGGFGYEIILHEIGHALGLKHPDDDGGNGRPTFAALGIATSDITSATVMSNNEIIGSGLLGGNAASPMPLDILAIQQIYGANMSYRTGDDTYTLPDPFTSVHEKHWTIWDAGGVDTIDASSLNVGFGGATMDLRFGGATFANQPTVQPGWKLYVAYGANIENAVGSRFPDTIFGNSADNTLDGKRGVDTLQGGNGDDLYIVDSYGDHVVENPGEGHDTVRTTSAYVLSDNIEDLYLINGAVGSASGNASNNLIIGSDALNTISGFAGNDTLVGGAGFDELRGGIGDDLYIIDDVYQFSIPSTVFDVEYAYPGGPTQHETFDENGSTIISRGTDNNGDGFVDSLHLEWTNGSSFWRIDITSVASAALSPGRYDHTNWYYTGDRPVMEVSRSGGSFSSGDGSFLIQNVEFGQQSSDSVGNFGSPLLVLSFDSPGTIYGGYARGTIVINALDIAIGEPDRVLEQSGEGIDWVQSAISFVLPDNVENLTLTGLANIRGSGNSQNNVLVGNSGANDLRGDLGNDTLDGGLGSDTVDYNGVTGTVTVNLAAQQASNDGQGSVDALISIENVLGSGLGDHLTGDDNKNSLAGNAGNDTIFAGAGSDVLYGGDNNDTLVGNADIFAQEADTLTGGTGDDTFYAEFTDSISGGSGTDFVYIVNAFNTTLDMGATSTEWVLSDFGNDTITAGGQTVAVTIYSGGGNDGLTGSAFDDTIYAGVGNDTVNGGDGADVIIGDLGADSLSGDNGNDRLYIDAADVFYNGGAGRDAAYITFGSAAMTIDMASRAIEFLSDESGGDDAITAALQTVGIEVYAGNGADSVFGSAFVDQLWGGGGNDTLTGGAGDDALIGQTGADVLTGGEGIDVLCGDNGDGGDASQDRFVFTHNWGTDFVFDFEPGLDKLDLTALGTSFGALTITADGMGTRVTLGADLFVIAGVAPANLTAGDYLF